MQPAVSFTGTQKKVVQSELEAMLEMGVIEESHSDWASPIVLVPKTDGSVRFCVDYRKVNAVCVCVCVCVSTAPGVCVCVCV